MFKGILKDLFPEEQKGPWMDVRVVNRFVPIF